MGELPAQALFETAAAVRAIDTNRLLQGRLLADDEDLALAARERGVEKVRCWW